MMLKFQMRCVTSPSRRGRRYVVYVMAQEQIKNGVIAAANIKDDERVELPCGGYTRLLAQLSHNNTLYKPGIGNALTIT